MNAAVAVRGLARGVRPILIVALAVAAMLVLGLAVYSRIDLGIYAQLPETVRALMGIPAHAAPAILAYSEMLASVGALAFVGVAIALGAQAVAGEEQDRTLSVILATPVSRTGYLLSRASALVALVCVGGVLLWVAAAAAPRVLGVATGDAHLAALIVHLCATAIFHAALAFAIGAATGRKARAAATAAAVMVLGWLGSSILPLWRAGAADWIPWHWCNGSLPLVNGIDAGQLALSLGGAAVLVCVGALGFRTRELRLTEHTGLLVRFRALPGLARLLTPTARGATPLRLRLAAQSALLGVVVPIIFAMGALLPLAYGPLSAAMGSFAKTFPPAISALFGGGDLATPAGFLHLETFGLVAPAAVILVGVSAASAGIAGEEQHRRMLLVLAQPISRARSYWTVGVAAAGAVVLVGLALGLGSWVGIAAAGLAVDIAHLGGACLLLILLGWWFTALALLCAAATGRTVFATWIPTGGALVSYFGATLLSAAGEDRWGWWSPFHAYLTGPPLAVGVTGWWQPASLAVGAALLALLGQPLFARRDLRISA